MSQSQARRWTIALMLILTIIVGGAALYIGYRVQQGPGFTSSGVCQSGGPNNICAGKNANETFEHNGGQYQCQPGEKGGVPDYTVCELRNVGGNKCPNNNNTISKCIVHNCPNGDTTGDGKCELDDTGATSQEVPAAQCSSARPTNNCGQVDAIDTNNDFCGYTFININCGSSSSTTSTPALVCRDLTVTSDIPDNGGDGFVDVQPGQTVRFRGRFDNCTATEPKMRLIVFTGEYVAGQTVGNPKIVPAASAVKDGSVCRYTFDWTATSVPAGRYKVRMAKANDNGNIGSADRIYNDVAACNARIDVVTPGVAVCGGTCGGTGNIQCPNNHTCNAGKCVLNDCLATGANCDPTKCEVLPPGTTYCGGDCNANVLCPNNHTCSAGKCVLTQCLQSGANCTPNKCQVKLPVTGLFDEDSRALLIGLALIVFGIVLNRLNSQFGLLSLAMYSVFSRNEDVDSERTETQANQTKTNKRDTSSFESRFLRRERK
jgi:hypothetical protein